MTLNISGLTKENGQIFFKGELTIFFPSSTVAQNDYFTNFYLSLLLLKTKDNFKKKFTHWATRAVFVSPFSPNFTSNSFFVDKLQVRPLKLFLVTLFCHLGLEKCPFSFYFLCFRLKSHFWQEMFTLTCPIHRGVCNLPHKFHLYLILNICLPENLKL